MPNSQVKLGVMPPSPQAGTTAFGMQPYRGSNRNQFLAAMGTHGQAVMEDGSGGNPFASLPADPRAATDPRGGMADPRGGLPADPRSGMMADPRGPAWAGGGPYRHGPGPYPTLGVMPQGAGPVNPGPGYRPYLEQQGLLRPQAPFNPPMFQQGGQGSPFNPTFRKLR